MIKQERHARICEYLDKHQFASINTLMEQIGASKSTVRRDLMELQEEKKIAFVRGGAASTNQQFVQESPYHVKQSTNTAEKERIGAPAAQLVQTGETIFLASGTTTRAVLPGLSEVDFLNLVTNDLQIAMDAAEMENIALTMTGGSVRPGYYALRGVLAEDSMRVMKTGTAFVSCDATSQTPTRWGCCGKWSNPPAIWSCLPTIPNSSPAPFSASVRSSAWI